MSVEPVIEESSTTRIKVVHISHKWTVDNFSLCKAETGKCLRSPTFPAKENNRKVTWQMELYPRGEDVESENYISLFLKLVTSNQSHTQAKCRFSLLNAKGEKRKIQHFLPHQFTLDDYSWGFKKYVARDILLKEDTVEFLSNDKLTILCECSFSRENSLVTTIDSSPKKRFKICDEFQLSNHLKTALDCQKFHDVIMSVGDREFPAHKAILAARSPVFAAMFEHEMKEKRNNRVTIEDIPPEVVEEMLTFIYTDKSPNLANLADNLLPAAEKYDLRGLKMMCEEALSSKLTNENAVSLLIMAEVQGANLLKEEAIHFISTHLADITKTQSWKIDMVKNSKLMSEIIYKVASVSEKKNPKI